MSFRTILVAGFNGFGQITALSNGEHFSETAVHEFVKCEKTEDCLDICLSWSYIMIVLGDKLTIHGFLNKNEPSLNTVDVKLPEGTSFIQGSCTRTKCLLITAQGECWQYSLLTESWKNLTRHLQAEIVDEENENVSFVKVVCGEEMALALTSSGTAYNIPNVLSPPHIKVKEIACGREHGLLLTEGGDIYTWGGGSRGQLGTGHLETSEDLLEVAALSGLIVTNIAAGGWHNCALTKDGDLYTWGWNKQGQLGHPMIEEKRASGGVAVLAEPRAVDWPVSEEVFVQEVACGASHTIAKLSDGSIWGCGWNKWGQLGLDDPSPIASMTLLLPVGSANVSRISCAPWNTALLCL